MPGQFGANPLAGAGPIARQPPPPDLRWREGAALLWVARCTESWAPKNLVEVVEDWHQSLRIDELHHEQLDGKKDEEDDDGDA